VRWIEPVYPKAGRGVRRWGWSGCCACISAAVVSTCRNPAVEEALYESVSLRGFCGHRSGARAGAGRDDGVQVPPLTGAWHQLGARIFERVQEHLQERGLRDRDGNDRGCDDCARSEFDQRTRARERDPEMPPDAQGKQWYFG